MDFMYFKLDWPCSTAHFQYGILPMAAKIYILNGFFFAKGKSGGSEFIAILDQIGKLEFGFEIYAACALEYGFTVYFDFIR